MTEALIYLVDRPPSMNKLNTLLRTKFQTGFEDTHILLDGAKPASVDFLFKSFPDIEKQYKTEWFRPDNVRGLAYRINQRVEIWEIRDYKLFNVDILDEPQGLGFNSEDFIKVGNFDPYFKSPFFTVKDWIIRARLRGLSEEFFNPWQDDPIDPIHLNQFHIKWGIDLDVKLEDFENWILEHYDWEEKFRI